MDTNFIFETSKDEKSLTTLKVKVDKNFYQKELDKQVEINKSKVSIKGFRVGHAPKEMILAKYREALEASADEAIIESAWSNYQEDKKVFALGTPKLTKIDKENGELNLSYEYYEMPNVEIPDLSTMTFEKDIFEVDDKSIENGYKAYIKRFSQFIEDEDNLAEEGDKVTVSLEFDADKNKKLDREITVVATKNEKDSIFAVNAFKTKKGDKKLLSTFVDGEEATLIMNILKVEKPDMKDDSSEEEKTKVKESLKGHFKARADKKAEDNLVNNGIYETLTKDVKFIIPKGYLDEQVDAALSDLEVSVTRQGSNMSEYLMSVAKTEEDLRQEYIDTVKKQIEFDLIMAKIAEVHKDEIIIDENKAREYAEKMYQQYSYMGLSKQSKQEQQDIIRSIMRESQNRSTSDAIIDYIKKTAVIKDKTPVSYEVTEQDLWMSY